MTKSAEKTEVWGGGERDREIESNPTSGSIPGAKLISVVSPYPQSQRSMTLSEGETERRPLPSKKLPRQHFEPTLGSWTNLGI